MGMNPYLIITVLRFLQTAMHPMMQGHQQAQRWRTLHFDISKILWAFILRNTFAHTKIHPSRSPRNRDVFCSTSGVAWCIFQNILHNCRARSSQGCVIWIKCSASWVPRGSLRLLSFVLRRLIAFPYDHYENTCHASEYGDVTIWMYISQYWHFVRGIHWPRDRWIPFKKCQ